MNPAASKDSKVRLSDHVELDEPVKRGETLIDKVQIRRPMGGEMRGLDLTDIASLNVNALIKALPRVTIPMLTEPEVAALDINDLTALGGELSSFLLNRRTKASHGL